ncbi:MAG: adenylate/guanylate cyclase domain-containing protein, partial [Candidatus Omnitrophica bacterium]|nr:adenylate/guanylate cyclase domain-containing protein [Candidatus Omnitrophota bacterium]
FCLFYYLQIQPFKSIDLKLYDLMFLMKGKEKPPEEVVIVAIDEPSIENLGRWPWNRDIIAKLIDKLSEYCPAVISFDVIFSEPEKNDSALAKSINSAGNVILPVVFFFDKKDLAEKIILHSSVKIINQEKFKKFAPVSSKRVLAPVNEIAEYAAGFGHINIFPDSDGTIRSETLYIEYNGYLVPSLSLKSAAFYLGIPEEKFLIDATRGIYLGKRHIKTDSYGRILIPYYGGNQTFKNIPVIDVLEGNVERQEIEGKIILIGATAVGIYDLRVTPFSSALPGVEKHANVIASLISGRYLGIAPHYAIIFSIILTGLLSIFIYERTRAGYSPVILLTLLVLIFSVSYLLFVFKSIWFSFLYSSANLFTQFIVIIAIKYAVSEKEARQIKKIFSSYVTEKVVNELIKNPSMAKLGGERRQVSVLFSDIRDFTSLSEKLQPENVVDLLNEYFGAMTQIIFKWEGTLDKFMGDAIMVFWGAPLYQPDHAERALCCAIEMCQELKELCEKWSEEGKPLLKTGIGINTGDVLVGNIGAEGKKMEYTVIGDCVNLASRLEGLNKRFNSEIIISEFTFEKIKGSIENGVFGPVVARGLGKAIVKGKEKPIRIYSIEMKTEGISSIIESPTEKIIVLSEK